MAIEWNEKLATGVVEIDEQHMELFRRFDNLLVACNEGKGKDEVTELLLFLDGYIKEHFAAEERLQLGCGYPEYPSHKEQHNRFVADVERLERQFRDEGATLPLVIQTNRTLVNWLIQHISNVDKRFADYLKRSTP